MSVKENRFHFTRGNSKTRRSMVFACAAACNAAMLSFMTPGAQAQASYTWTSSSSGNWSDTTKWMGGSVPVASGTGDASLEFNAASAYTSNNDLGAFGVYNMTFDAGNGPTTLTGGEIDLYWPLSENNNPAFTDNSTNPVTVDNNVTFETTEAQDGGTSEYFVIAPGSTATFNGTVNLTGDSQLKMTNGEATSNLGGPGGTMIWTQPLVFTNSPQGPYGGYFPFRIYEGTLEMGGYTIDNGQSDATPPVVNVDGVNEFGTGGVNNGAPGTDVYLGPEDRYTSYSPASGVLLHPNDVVSFYLIAAGDQMNNRVEVGDAGTITIGGLNTSGTVYFNSYFNTLPTDGDGEVAGKSQTIYYSAAAGGTVVQNFQMITGLASEPCEASIDKIGPGTWIVAAGGTNNAGEQAYNGNTTVRDGTLELAYDDTGTNNVTLPAAAISAGAPEYQSGADGGSLGFNAPTNAVQLGDSGTLATDNIALLTLTNPGAPGPRQVLHNISVNNFNPSGSTTIGVGDNGTGNFSGNIALAGNVVLTGGTGGLANFSGNITGTGAVTANGTGTVNLSGSNSYSGGTTVTSGTLQAANASALPANKPVTVTNGLLELMSSISGTGNLNLNGVTISGGTLQLDTNATLGSQSSPTPASNVNITSLSISGTGALNLNNNHIIIDYTAGNDPIASIAAWVDSGANVTGGVATWTGTGITSTAAAANAKSYGIGYADAADPGNPAHLASGQIEVMYTLLGDANLDGKVNGTDFNILATNFNTGGDSWDQGDFTYDGKVNGSDFNLLAQNFNQGASQAADMAALQALEVAYGFTTGSIAVPEPASAAILVMTGMGILRRRRRTSR